MLQRKNFAGAVLVEFALVIPVMFLFLSGVLEFGNYLAQTSWLAQTAYNSAMKGAETPDLGTARSDEVKERFNKLWAFVNARSVVKGHVEAMNQVDIDSNGINDLVRVRITGSILPLLPQIFPFKLPISVEVAAPILLLQNTNFGLTNNFQNPSSSSMYRCNGTLRNGGSNDTCDDPEDPDDFLRY